MQEFSSFHCNYRWLYDVQMHVMESAREAQAGQGKHKIAIKITLDASRDLLIRQTMRQSQLAQASHTHTSVERSLCVPRKVHHCLETFMCYDCLCALCVAFIALERSNQCAPLINVAAFGTTIAWFGTVCAALFISLRPGIILRHSNALPSMNN